MHRKKDIMNDPELKRRLLQVITMQPISVKKLAKEIGLNYITLRCFLKDEKATSFKNVKIIERYVLMAESALKLNKPI